MNDFMMQGLAYVIDVSNGDSPKSITVEGSEFDTAKVISQALSIVEADSPEFAAIVAGLGVEKYCNITTIKLISALRKNINEGNFEAAKELISEITIQDIPGKVFKKSVAYFCVSMILSLRLLKVYKTYVSNSLEIIQDTSIEDISLFSN